MKFKHKKTKLSILTCCIFLILLPLTSHCSNKTEHLIKNKSIMINDTLPSEEFAIGTEICSFRIITLTDKFFSFRKPDYNGGFFFGLQIASATNREHNKKVEFDKIKKISNYIIYAKEDVSARQGTWYIPHYNMYYIKIEPPFDISTFDLDSYKGEWLLYKEAEARSILPQDLMVLAQLNVYSSNNKDETMQWDKYVESLNNFQRKAIQNETFDLELIDKLKEEKKYDTIIRTTTSNLYYNTDLEAYEQPLDSNIFYLIRKKYYTNGAIKEKHYFYPGVYTSNALPIFSVYFDELGEANNAKSYMMEYGFNGAHITIEYLIKLLDYEKQINFKTGEGKPIMTINNSVNPHDINRGNIERLNIRSKWQITADDDPKSSIGLLIKHEDDSETVYLIDKSTRIILKKFKR